MEGISVAIEGKKKEENMPTITSQIIQLIDQLTQKKILVRKNVLLLIIKFEIKNEH